MKKSTSENRRQMLGEDAQPKIDLVGVTPDGDTREILFRLVEMLGRQGITVTPSKKGSLLKHDA